MKIENVAVIPLEEYEEYAKWKQLKDKPVIDYDRLCTGSVVKIKYTGEHCNGISKIDLSSPVDIIFYKTNCVIHDDNKFISKAYYESNITFHQNGKYCVFSSERVIDYITEVISY